MEGLGTSQKIAEIALLFLSTKTDKISVLPFYFLYLPNMTEGIIAIKFTTI